MPPLGVDIDDELDADIPPIDVPLPDPEPDIDEFGDATQAPPTPEISIEDFDGLAEDELTGLLIGDRDGDGEMEIY